MDFSDEKLSNQLYYQEIIKYLENPTQYHKACTELNWVKIQSLNYFVSLSLHLSFLACLILSTFLKLKNGVLYYGKRKPRRVVIDDESKVNILQQIHVDKTKGKMWFRLINV